MLPLNFCLSVNVFTETVGVYKVTALISDLEDDYTVDEITFYLKGCDRGTAALAGYEVALERAKCMNPTSIKLEKSNVAELKGLIADLRTIKRIDYYEYEERICELGGLLDANGYHVDSNRVTNYRLKEAE